MHAVQMLNCLGTLTSFNKSLMHGPQWKNARRILNVFACAAGFTGSTGFTGDTGFTGFTGDTGFTGFTGATGYTGSTGFTGFTGATGYTGATGSTGFTGSTGTTGKLLEWAGCKDTGRYHILYPVRVTQSTLAAKL